MQAQERASDLGDILDGLGNGRADVVKLHVEKHPLARARKRDGKRQSAGKQQLIADLIEHHGVAEPLDHKFGVAHRGKGKRNDQADISPERHRTRNAWPGRPATPGQGDGGDRSVPNRGGGAPHPNRRASSTRRASTTPSSWAAGSSRRLPSASNA